ncbi:glycosyltransferase [Agromyces laixinhei]|uniref:glycosyltransferase n=1 Tax=Agromyces laixinhei TaxID=2585717 RepID=UPI0018DE252E|nr:nucleotide disphospho-sugar-binding domain-containing protein [Agromyces laixinhei]
MTGHVELVSPPFAGHLHPMLGIGAELVRRGVPVRVVSTGSARAEIEAAGLPAVALESADDRVIAAIVDPPERIGANPVRLHRQFRGTLGVLATISEELDRRYREELPAIVVADFTLPVAGMAARRHGARWFTAMPSPAAIGSVDGTPAYFGGWSPPRGLSGRARDAAGRGAARAFKRGVFAMNAARLRALGFSGAFRPDGTEQVYSPDTVLGLGLAELELQRTWPPAMRFVGPVRYTPPGRPGAWGAPASSDREPHASSPDAAAPRRPRVLVSCGTHLAGTKAELLETAELVAELLPGVHLEMTLGGTRANGGGDLTRVRLLEYADYGELGGYDAVVHHGGAGIVHAALAAGLPAVVVPIDYDQPDLAARLVHHGLAERLSPAELRGASGAARLAAAIERALVPAEARRGALERFRLASGEHDGAAGAADLIEEAWVSGAGVGDESGGVRR